MLILFSAIIPYLLGSINGAYYMTKLFKKQDIRTLESGNAGATNAGRVLGKKGFVLTVLIDATKTWLALWLTGLWFGDAEWALLFALIFVFLGHLYPVHLQFRGGKGVVVYLAGALWIEPVSLAVVAGVTGISYGVLRRYTISGFIAILSVPVTLFCTYGFTVIPVGMSLAFILLLVVHKK
ncbi:glycerol-3-phosphate acyltransferase [Jeotgalibacillus terrae]|uniref:Glycerol-3-phosphate acyltransferase n=1 Tax=Jeotgalibacillus terrae TaxID=587735 RepID=A0ABW5ZJI5_9BACL|nr:glycerol-3-phosphate acyltransferase [Jeotgalibacillus terrae]MBM7579362.1 glycerol-3-phosphate acyltransferase PlsY [Jeotgalibacillus terrae]